MNHPRIGKGTEHSLAGCDPIAASPNRLRPHCQQTQDSVQSGRA